jgi:hypothetical protein
MNCPDCDVAPGAWHHGGCPWEQCPYCGEHLADCDCSDGLPPLDDRIRWPGCCPWIEACLEFDFFEKKVRGTWVRCRAEDPDSQPDVTRLLRECVWNREDKRFEKRRRVRRDKGG